MNGPDKINLLSSLRELIFAMSLKSVLADPFIAHLAPSTLSRGPCHDDDQFVLGLCSVAVHIITQTWKLILKRNQ